MTGGYRLGDAVMVLSTDGVPLETGMAKAYANVDRQSLRMQRTIDQRMVAMGKSMERTGASMSRNVTLPIVAVAAASAKMAADFQASTEKLRTQAGATQAQVAKLRSGILDMATAVGTSPDQLSAGMYHVVSSMNAVIPASQRVSGELKVLRLSAELAKVGGSNLEDTTYALASAMNALHAPISQTSKIAGQLNAIVGAGDMTMTDLIESFKSGLVPGAKSAGLSLQSLGAALAVMGDMGMRGSLAGTRLRMSIALLSSPSAAAAKVLDTLGMSATQATSTSAAMAAALEKAGLRTTRLAADLKQPNGFMVALQDLNNHLRQSGLTATGAAAVMNKAFGGGRMGATITLLAQNTDRLGLKFKQIGHNANQFGADWKATTETASFKWQSFVADVDKDAIKLGNSVLPIVTTIAKDVTGGVDAVANAFNSLPKGMQQTIITGGLVLAAIGPAMKVMGVFTSGIGHLLQVAKIAGQLTGLTKAGGIAAGVGSGKVMQTVDTMEVGTLIAKTMVGGGGKIPGQPTSFPGGAAGEGAAGAASASAAAAAARAEAAAAQRTARLTTGIAGTSVAGVIALAAMSHAQGGVLNQVNAGVHGILGWIPGVDSVLPGVKPRINLNPTQIAELGVGLPLSPATTRMVTASQGLSNPDRLIQQQTLEKIAAMIAPSRSGGSTITAAGSAAPSVSQLKGIQARGIAEQLVGMTLAEKQAIDASKKLGPASAAMFQMISDGAHKIGAIKFGVSNALAADLVSGKKVSSDGVKSIIGELDKLTPATKADTANAMLSLTSQLEKAGSVAQGTTKAMRVAIASEYDLMVSDAGTKMGKLADKIAAGSQSAANVAGQNYSNMQASIYAAMNAGVLTSAQGAAAIQKNLNSVLSAFGAKPIPLPALVASEGKNPLGAFVPSKGGTIGHGATAAGGGLFQIGQPGERGYDSVPLNVGGMPITVAPGEQVAVFNRHQLPVVNAALAGFGGLPGLFDSIRTPNYMARGGLVGRRRFASGGAVGAGIAEASLINSKHYPYVWGGGHNAGFSGPYDCSGSVSAVLHAMHLLNAPEVAQQFMSYGLPGPGDVTLYATPSHVYMSLLGRFFGTHGSSGAGWFAGAPRAGFVERHPPVGMSSLKPPGVKGTGASALLARSALGLMAKAGNQRVSKAARASMSGGRFGGGDWGTFSGGTAGTPAQARAWTAQAMRLAGVSGPLWSNMLLRQEGRESSYRTNPAPPHDINWQRGDPAEGILQITGSNFARYGHGSITNPVDNIVAAIRYMIATYGGGNASRAAQVMWARGGGPYARGGLVGRRRFAKGGGVTADVARAHAATSHGAAHHSKQSKSSKPSKMPYFKSIPGFPTGRLTDINSLDAHVQELGDWLGYLQTLHGANPVAPLVTLADGSEVVNWAGMIDPATGMWAKGINARLAEIGDPGSNPNKTATRDKNTELGVDELILDALTSEQKDAVKAWKAFQPWLRKAKNVKARYERWVTEKAKLPQQKVLRDATLAKRFAEAKHRLQIASATGTFDSGQLKSAQVAALAAEQRDALAGVPSRMPAGWIGDGATWSATAKGERATITDEFAQRKLALSKVWAAKKLQGKISKSNAMFALSQGETAEKLAVSTHFADLTNTLAARIKSTAPIVNSLTNAQGATGFEATLKSYVDPMGTLSLATLQKANIDIPGLLTEIATLTKTPVQVPAAVDNSQLLADALQQLQTSQEAPFVSQQQYKVPASMPPYGGSFAAGGIVPGPAGAPRTVIAHGGEPIGMTSAMHVLVERDGQVRAYRDGVEQQVTVVNRAQARAAIRNSRLAGSRSVR